MKRILHEVKLYLDTLTYILFISIQIVSYVTGTGPVTPQWVY